MRITRRMNTKLASLLAAALLACAAPASAASVTVMVFPGLQNLPMLAALQQGYFKKRGVDVDLKYAPNSEEARNGLAEGRYAIIHTAVDNAVAMVEKANIPVVVVMGGDSGATRLIARPEIGDVADLRGQPVAVDALDTAYAFQLYAMLEQRGVVRPDQRPTLVGSTPLRLKSMQEGATKASILNPPYSLVALRGGMKDMGVATAALGPYQATSAFVRRDWAAANRDTLVAYLAAYIEGVRWARDPNNKAEAMRLLTENLKIGPDLAEECYVIAANPREGLAPDAKLDAEGFANVLRLRSRFAPGAVGEPGRYIDETFYAAARALLN